MHTVRDWERRSLLAHTVGDWARRCLLAHTVQVRARRCLLVGATFALGLAPHVSAQPARAGRTQGWSFLYLVTTASGASRASEARVQFAVTVWQGGVRVVPTNGELAQLVGADGYVVLLPGDSVLHLISPARRTVLRVRRDELAALRGGPESAPVSGFRTSSRDAGQGATFAGYATRRRQETLQYTTRPSLGTTTRTLLFTSTAEQEQSAAISRLDPGFDRFMDQFINNAGPGILSRPQRARVAASATARFPVTSRTQLAIVVGTDTVRIQSNATMSALRAVVVDTTQFVVPAGYQVTDASRLLQRPRLRAVTPP
jgi:hypothetical protein